MDHSIEAPTVRDALEAAAETAISQPSEIPEAPAGWIEQAQAALEAGDEGQICLCAGTIRLAHSRYRADFDIKGWLYDLRLASRADR